MKNKKLRLGLAAYTSLVLGLGGYVLLDSLVLPHELESVGITAADLNESDTTQASSVQETSGTSSTASSTHGHLNGKRHSSSNASQVSEVSESTSADTTTTTDSTTSSASATATTYSDDNVQITLTTTRVNDTTVYIADVQLSSVDYLKTAFAQGTYARNVKAETSAIAEENDAILAINGDFYGWRDTGYVLRNGTLYRETTAGNDVLVIDSSGNMYSVADSEVSARELLAAGAVQVLSFGPTLVEDGQVAVSTNAEVGQSMSSNPRTAIGMVSPLHYVFVVSDGRTSESAGLSLFELAQVMRDAGCTFAYNLDGGGSSTMWFNGTVVNNPTSGRSSGERAVSDIVYIGA